ncbi:hypothetical protein Cgig2_018871 [Carnegiea gigantea]|uniref:Uncharacterized protein n=1 Tax=Carnegiea gigantea TaxID=171969 RepID=A0A9Q1QFU9_9CARY|nr:hypothetical protein Cgig2_018871 [Carnegiea gigantea]
MWSEVHLGPNIDGKQISISSPPLHKRWVPHGHGPTICLLFTHLNEFISRYEKHPLRERFFHFSSESIARLKVKANEESSTHKISSFQALSALVWRSIIRVNHLPHSQLTKCVLAINNRPRLDPPLPQSYFGNAINVTITTTAVGELLEHNLGSANKFPGKVSAFPGCEGGGSVELEICFLSDTMRALESDEEFMAAVSFSV